MVCLPREKMIERLKIRYEERLIAQGLAADGRLLEVFAEKHGETWSAILTSPSGISCLIAAGEFWLILPGSSQRNFQSEKRHETSATSTFQ
jgi:hypothetical protein